MLYDLYDTRTGQKVGELNETGLHNCTDPGAQAVLSRIVGRDLLTRADEEAFGEVIEEGEMCYLDQVSVTPSHPDYLAVLVRQLPILTHYEARPSIGMLS
ncbi:MAG TPA: hypothetical protein VH186_35280 [Chloroflexia bacterium]|nr:hypothetical protein [Chloroflexia bacterium]